MSGPAVRQPRIPGASASVFIGTFGVVIALIVFLFVFDTFLARVEDVEASSRAESAYADGQRLLAAGRVSDAADRFLTAASMDRTQPVYTLAVAQARLMQGKTADAERLLRTTLQRDPTDGTANVLMARVLEREGRQTEATSYFHRAIYGRWRADAAGSSMKARFELIDLLARTHARKELLAELLPIQDQLLGDLALRDSLGRLFLVAGSPARAADVFRDVISRQPGDAQAYAGLGAAALALGNFRTAAGDLARAARLAPHDSTIAEQLELARTVVALDPSERGLRLRERYERSRRMVQLSAAAASRCASDQPDAAMATTVGVADSVLRDSLRPAPARMSDAVDENLSLSQRLWGSRTTRCAVSGSVADSALALLQETLARQEPGAASR